MTNKYRYQVRESNATSGKYVVSDTEKRKLVRDRDGATHFTERDAHDLAEEYRHG